MHCRKPQVHIYTAVMTFASGYRKGWTHHEILAFKEEDHTVRTCPTSLCLALWLQMNYWGTFKYKWSKQVYKEGQNMVKSKWKTNATTNKVKVQMSLEFMLERRLECCTSCWQGKGNPQETRMGGVDIFIVLLWFSICPFLSNKIYF